MTTLPGEKIVRGDVIAQEAQTALTADGFTTQPGHCQMWVRQVVQAAYGAKFDSFWRGSAVATMEAFEGTRYCLKPDVPLIIGDILYKGRLTSGPFGHVAIVIPGGRVAENSSSHWDPEADDPDARGIRTFAAFGQFERVVRLSLYGEGA